MSLDQYKDELEKYEFMMGFARGRLAVTMDVLTDALVLAGQHGVYCRSNKNPAKPAQDIQTIVEALNDAKELIRTAMEEIKRERESRE